MPENTENHSVPFSLEIKPSSSVLKQPLDPEQRREIVKAWLADQEQYDAVPPPLKKTSDVHSPSALMTRSDLEQQREAVKAWRAEQRNAVPLPLHATLDFYFLVSEIFVKIACYNFMRQYDLTRPQKAAVVGLARDLLSDIRILQASPNENSTPEKQAEKVRRQLLEDVKINGGNNSMFFKRAEALGPVNCKAREPAAGK